MKKTLNKTFGLATMALFGFLFFSPHPVMAAAISMSNTPAEITGNLSFTATPGQTGSLSIFIDNDQAAIYSFQFNLSYNSSAITINSVVHGGASSVSTCNTDASTTQSPGCNLLFNTSTTGTVRVGYYSSNALPQTNGQQVVVVNYTVNNNAAGDYAFTITQAMLNESSTQPATVTTGTMTVIVPALSLTAPTVPSVIAGSALSVPLSGTYSGLGSLNCNVTGLPNSETGSCSISGTSSYTGTFSWTPSALDIGSFPVTFTITDGTLNATQQETIVVSPVPIPPPSTPTGLAATAGNALVNLSWTASTGATSYTVERSTSSNGTYAALSAGTGISGISFTDSTAANGTTYYYEVKANNGGGNSALSSPVNATPEPAAPSVPTGLTAAAGNAQVNLSWTSVAGVSYTLARSTDDVTFSNIATGVSAASYQDTSLNNGTKYYYEIQGVNGGGSSAFSAAVNATPEPAIPSIPTGLAAVAGIAQVNLSWTSVAGVTYNLARSTDNVTFSNIATAVSAATYQDTSLSNGTKYYYKIQAVNGGGSSGFSAVVNATPEPAAPSSPTGLAATAGISSVNLSWTTSTGATSYTVERSTSSNGTYLALAAGTGISGTSFTDSTAANGTTYYYEVEAINGGGNSVLSSPVNATPQPAAPSVPTGLTAAAGNAQVNLSWTSVVGVTYTLARSTDDVTFSNIATGVSAASYQDTSLNNGTKYYYEIQGVNGGGSSAFSAAVNATPEPAIPSVPTGLTAAAGNALVNLSWTFVTGVTYNLARSTDNVTFSNIATAVAAASYQDSSLTNGTRYYYEIQAANGGGNSAFSASVNAMPEPPAPSTPTGLTAVAGIASVNLSWSASSGATSYTLARSTDGSNYTNLATGITSTSYQDTSLTNGTKYYYELRAINAGGSSALSSPVNATPEPAAPSTPTGFTATAGNALVNLSWTATTGATSYTLARSTDDVTFTNIATAVAATSYQDKSLANGTIYYYEVEAINGGGSSALSTAANATPEPPAPTVSISPTNSTVTAGTSVTFTATPVGTGPFTYQWQKGGTPIPSATSSSYVISSAATTDSGSYAVVVTNGGGSGTSNTATLTVNLSITVTASPSGDGSVTCGNTTVSCASAVSPNASVKFFADPITGFVLSNWTVQGETGGQDCSGTTGTCTVTVSAATTVTANFVKQTFAMIASSDSNGTISPPNATVPYGASQAFTVTPNAGYVASVTDNGVAQAALTGTTYTVSNVTASHTIAVIFNPILTLTAANGSVAETVNGQSTTATSFAPGTEVTLTASPSSGYSLSGWTVSSGAGSDCAGTTGTCTVTLSAATTASASFAQNAACGTASQAYVYGTTSFGANTLCAVGTSNPSTVVFPAPSSSVSWTCQAAVGPASSCTATQKSKTVFRAG